MNVALKVATYLIAVRAGEQLQAHVDSVHAELVAAGATPDQAREALVAYLRNAVDQLERGEIPDSVTGAS